MATYNGLSDAARYALSAADAGNFGYDPRRGSYYADNHRHGVTKVIDRRTVQALRTKGYVETIGGRLTITEAGREAYRAANRKRRATEGSDD